MTGLSADFFLGGRVLFIWPSDFPIGSDSKESACSAGDASLTLGPEDPLGKGMSTHSVFLP